jgi:hypothetical protein
MTPRISQPTRSRLIARGEDELGTDRGLPPTAARFLTFLRHAGPFD